MWAIITKLKFHVTATYKITNGSKRKYYPSKTQHSKLPAERVPPAAQKHTSLKLYLSFQVEVQHERLSKENACQSNSITSMILYIKCSFK